MKPELVVLAAGSGSRFGGEKQLAEVGPGGEALLEYTVFDAVRAGFGRVTLVVREGREAVFRARLDRMGRRVPLRWVEQRLDDLPEGWRPPPGRTRPWGTAHAVLAAARALDRPFAVVNADDHYGGASFARLGGFLGAARGDRRLAAVGFRLGDTLSASGPVSRALLEVNRSGRLRAVSELPRVWREAGRIRYRGPAGEAGELGGDELVSMNLWGLTPAFVDELGERLAAFPRRLGEAPEDELRLPEEVQAVIAAGLFEVEVLPAGGSWCGLTFGRDLARVRRFLRARVDRGDYPPDLWR